MAKKAAILIATGFEETEALVPFDLLTGSEVQTDLVSVEDKTAVISAHGLTVTGLLPMSGYDFPAADLLVLPGGYGGYQVLKTKDAVRELAAGFLNSPDKVLGAICASAALLGEWGLLKGRSYVCYPGMNGDFGGTFRQEHAVTDGNLVTGISAGGSFQFGFDLIKKLLGREKADEVRRLTCWLTQSGT